MKWIISVILLICALLVTACAEGADYSYLEGMDLEQLEALQTEVEKRISSLKTQQQTLDPNDMGMWGVYYYVDEFRLPTDEAYISNKDWIVGTFSNSAVSNRTLKVNFLIDDSDLAIVLYEYGDNRVNNYYSKKKYYDVVVMDANGVRYNLEGYYYSNGDRMFFSSEDEATLVGILKQNGTVRFSIKMRDSMDSYLFTLEDSSYFTNAYNAMMKK